MWEYVDLLQITLFPLSFSQVAVCHCTVTSVIGKTIASNTGGYSGL
jgi:hypothetical protein